MSIIIATLHCCFAGMNMQIDFSSNLLSLLDRGMIVCHCHIRGGSERGRSWYEQEGKFFTKKNSFEDTFVFPFN
jgi:oligopeptidase B